MRLTMRSEVVLPQPEGPTSTVISPSRAVSDSDSRPTVPSAKRFPTSRNSITCDAPGFRRRPRVGHRVDA